MTINRNLRAGPDRAAPKTNITKQPVALDLGSNGNLFHSNKILTNIY